MNILQSLGSVAGGAGLSIGIGIIESIEPKLKPEIDVIQQDIKDGIVTIENFKSTIDTTIKTAEAYVPEKYDSSLEQVIVVIDDLVELEQRIAAIPKD